MRDQLTGLPNRSFLKTDLLRAVTDQRYRNRQFTLLFVDLDGFKPINDRHGHSAGDEVLRQVSRRLKACVREYDTVCRLGGDEFVIVLREVKSRRNIETVAEKILSSVSVPFEIDGVSMGVGCSIGISHYPTDGEAVEVLLEKADRAMYQAKREGKGRYHMFASGDHPGGA